MKNFLSCSSDRIYCYVVNLEQERAKKRYMEDLLSAKFSNLLFFKAIDGRNLSASELLEVYDAEQAIQTIGRELTLGEIGCALSQLSIIREVASRGHTALILEDDIETSLDEKKLELIIDRLPVDWECVLLGHHSRYSRVEEGVKSVWHSKSLIDGISCFRFAERPAGGYGYLINKAGAEKVLANYKVISKPVDFWLDSVINLYGVTPALVHVVDIASVKSQLDNEREKLVPETEAGCFFICDARKIIERLGVKRFLIFLLRCFNKIRPLSRYK